VVVVDFKHVSATGSGAPAEQKRPRFHNPGEAEAVCEVLRLVRASKADKRPTLAVLSFYKAQVEKLSERIDAGIRNKSLAHLGEFASAIGSGGGWVSTVDGFQGNEADLIILSLVRNNASAGASALGFLRDRRRMNVALSRAKSKLVIVGSLAFMREAVRGVNPDAGKHDLSFLTVVGDTIQELRGEKRSDGVPLATYISPEELRAVASAC
jgi:superfamily I DNA and/or RNA helicase